MVYSVHKSVKYYKNIFYIDYYRILLLIAIYLSSYYIKSNLVPLEALQCNILVQYINIYKITTKATQRILLKNLNSMFCLYGSSEGNSKHKRKKHNYNALIK